MESNLTKKLNSMKKTFLSLMVISSAILYSCAGGEQKTEEPAVIAEPICFYEFDKTATTTVKWTAFKTTEKKAVGGAFAQVNVTAGEKSTKITDVLQTIKFTIPTSSTNTENPDRDAKIVESFFGTMESTDLIIGQVKLAEGDNVAGKCTVFLTMNNIEKEVVLDYTVAENIVSLKGEIDLVNWSGDAAIAALNKVCKDLHKGEDGVTKLWSVVELNIESALKKECN